MAARKHTHKAGKPANATMKARKAMSRASASPASASLAGRKAGKPKLRSLRAASTRH